MFECFISNEANGADSWYLSSPPFGTWDVSELSIFFLAQEISGRPILLMRIGSPCSSRQWRCFSIVKCLNHKTPGQEFDTSWGNSVRRGLRTWVISVGMLPTWSGGKGWRTRVGGLIIRPIASFNICFVISYFPLQSLKAIRLWFGFGFSAFFSFSPFSIIRSGKEYHLLYRSIFKQCFKKTYKVQL